jgi:hypothetical protein
MELAMEQDVFSIIPEGKRRNIKELISSLSQVKGIKAIALGGSYARGTAKPESDIDLGLYYSDVDLLDISNIKEIVIRTSLPNKPSTVTGLYEWGPWVNGGAWIETSSGKIDLLYRNLEQVEKVIQDSNKGKFFADFLQQPPYGFYSVTYLAEIKACIPLFDPTQLIHNLKEKVLRYPERLKAAIVQENLWSIEFTLLYAKKCVTAYDVYTTAGCVTRILSCLTQVLFALNEEYFISDREAMNAIEHFKLRPEEYKQSVEAILRRLDLQGNSLSKSIKGMEKLFLNMKKLAGSLYASKYQLS